MAGLEEAVKSGRISEKRIDESVRRILQAKARLGLDKNRVADVARLNEKFARPEYASEAQGIADRGVTLLRDSAETSAARCDAAAARPARVAFRRSRSISG